jgi:hypothetical protein
LKTTAEFPFDQSTSQPRPMPSRFFLKKIRISDTMNPSQKWQANNGKTLQQKLLENK